MVFVSGFCRIRPQFEIAQPELMEWIAKAHSRSDPTIDIRSTLVKIGARSDKIQNRGTILSDCTHTHWDEMELYHFKEGATLTERLRIYEREVDRIFDSFFPLGTPLPAHLIHVTCTGYVAPSGAQKLVSKRGGQTLVTHAYHMGCYAAIPAIRMALGGKDTAIVHTEVCSLHMNPTLHSIEQLVVQLLFGDGFIKYAVSDKGPGFEIVNILEEIIPETTETMSWKCEEWGFKMTLSKEVPQAIAARIPSFLAKLGASRDAFYAIHPGGPKIIESVARILGLKSYQFSHSEEVLKNYGNMSSATLPHIWELMWNDPAVKDGDEIVSLAFGPGLTLAGAVFRCRR